MKVGGIDVGSLSPAKLESALVHCLGKTTEGDDEARLPELLRAFNLMDVQEILTENNEVKTQP